MARIRIIVEVEGGVVTAVYSDLPDSICVDVLDRDNMKVETDEEALALMKRLEGELPLLKPAW